MRDASRFCCSLSAALVVAVVALAFVVGAALKHDRKQRVHMEMHDARRI